MNQYICYQINNDNVEQFKSVPTTKPTLVKKKLSNSAVKTKALIK